MHLFTHQMLLLLAILFNSFWVDKNQNRVTMPPVPLILGLMFDSEIQERISLKKLYRKNKPKVIVSLKTDDPTFWLQVTTPLEK